MEGGREGGREGGKEEGRVKREGGREEGRCESLTEWLCPRSLGLSLMAVSCGHRIFPSGSDPLQQCRPEHTHTNTQSTRFYLRKSRLCAVPTHHCGSSWSLDFDDSFSIQSSFNQQDSVNMTQVNKEVHDLEICYVHHVQYRGMVCVGPLTMEGER